VTGDWGTAAAGTAVTTVIAAACLGLAAARYRHRTAERG
jgi:hypothetical protein